MPAAPKTKTEKTNKRNREKAESQVKPNSLKEPKGDRGRSGLS